MDYQIAFPHLGIFLDHVIRSIRIGSFEIAMYGIMIAAGMVLGIFLVTWRAGETGQNPDDYIDVVLWTVLSGIIGARIYYVAFSWSEYRGDLLSVFNLREGGLAIYGGLIAGTAAVGILSYIKKIPFPVLLDTCIIGVPAGQVLGRWGNFFNREAFGTYTDGLFAMRLPVSAVRVDEITKEMWEHMEVLNGVQFIQAHPTFLYEGFWNLGVLLLLILIRKKVRFKGELFLIYLICYGTGRFFIEMLRTDQLLIPGTSVPVSMVVSAAAVLISAALIAFLKTKKRT